MGESVIVRQNSDFETEILARDPHDPDAHQFYPVDDVHQLTPYGMLLSGLGSCTGIVLHTYAQYHGVDLQEVELRLKYDRVFADDCKDCERIEEYREQIEEEITLIGELTPQDRRRLFMVSRHCPIHKMLAHGIEVKSHLAQEQSQG
jgi:putative redox protein